VSFSDFQVAVVGLMITKLFVLVVLFANHGANTSSRMLIIGPVDVRPAKFAEAIRLVRGYSFF
jgi:hypothetical protein